MGPIIKLKIEKFAKNILIIVSGIKIMVRKLPKKNKL
jgi:hypothetical protein